MSHSKDLSDILLGFLQSCAKFLLFAGGLAALLTGGFLYFMCFRVTGAAVGVDLAEAGRNVETFQRIFWVGTLAAGVGSSYLYWGEELLGAIQLLLGGALWAAPLYMPVMLTGTNHVVGQALGSLQVGGSILGAIGIVCLVVDLVTKAKDRVQKGTKADHFKFGKGTKEDPDKQNILLGKCWQLPYCRKFVRERCPIYHSKRTCWKERVGCMCEEEVIRGALENRPIPKDALMAASLIPRNQRLTPEQKAERCRNCVIYNEHQRHKYKVLLPTTLGAFLLLYALLRTPLLAAMERIIETANDVVHLGTMGAAGRLDTPPAFVELLLVLLVIVGLSYALKVLELLIFKLKV